MIKMMKELAALGFRFQFDGLEFDAMYTYKRYFEFTPTGQFVGYFWVRIGE